MQIKKSLSLYRLKELITVISVLPNPALTVVHCNADLLKLATFSEILSVVRNKTVTFCHKLVAT